MPTRSIAWMMTAALVLAVVACDQTDTASGATESDGSPSASTAVGDPSGTSDDLDVDERIEEAHDSIEDAAGDLCATLRAAAAPLEITPGTVEEAEAAAELILAMLHHMGEVAGADAPIYQRVAEHFEDDFDDADHSPDWLRSPSAFESLGDPAFVEATARLTQRARQECPRG